MFRRSMKTLAIASALAVSSLALTGPAEAAEWKLINTQKSCPTISGVKQCTTTKTYKRTSKGCDIPVSNYAKYMGCIKTKTTHS
jgi:hypothetical protein